MTTTTFTIAVTADNSYVEGSGATYPPAFTTASTGGDIYTQQAYPSGTYFYDNCVFRWDTSAIGAGALISAASLIVQPWFVQDDESRGVIGDYHAWTPPAGASDYSTSPGSNAFTAVPISGFTSGVDKTIALLNPDSNISKTGVTGLRISVNGGAPALTKTNIVGVKGRATTATLCARLVVTYANAPSAPTLGTITPGNAQLSAAFTAGSDGGSAITSYKYSTDNGATYLTRQTGSTASPIVITTLSSDGTTPLTNGTAYTVLIKAVNVVGDGTASNAVTATPSTTPSAPTALVVTPGNAQLSVAFTAGATGGSAITTYKYSTDNGSSYLSRQTGTTASPVVITTLSSDGTTPLVNGTTYHVLLKAVNANGDGTASAEVDGTPVAPTEKVLKSALTMGVGM